MPTRMSTLIILVALTACASQRKAEFDAAVHQCDAEHPPRVGNYIALETCINAASLRLFGSDSGSALIRATRIELAEKVDAGQMSPAEAKAYLANVAFEVDQRVAQTNATQQAAAAQALSAAAAMSSAMRPAPVVPYVIPSPAAPWSAACFRTGAFVSCNGN